MSGRSLPLLCLLMSFWLEFIGGTSRRRQPFWFFISIRCCRPWVASSPTKGGQKITISALLKNWWAETPEAAANRHSIVFSEAQSFPESISPANVLPYSVLFFFSKKKSKPIEVSNFGWLTFPLYFSQKSSHSNPFLFRIGPLPGDVIIFRFREMWVGSEQKANEEKEGGEGPSFVILLLGKALDLKGLSLPSFSWELRRGGHY